MHQAKTRKKRRRFTNNPRPEYKAAKRSTSETPFQRDYRVSTNFSNNFRKKSFSVIEAEMVLEKKQVPCLATHADRDRVEFGVFARINLYPGIVFPSTKLFSQDLKYIGEQIPPSERCILFYINEALVEPGPTPRHSPVNVKFIDGCVVTLCFIAEGEQLFIDYGEQYNEQRKIEGYASFADHPIQQHSLIARLRWDGRNAPINAHLRAWQLVNSQ
jgi:hypothetical protein